LGVTIRAVKGIIRVRPTKDGEKRYTCQVFAGNDPLTAKKRYLTAPAKTERLGNSVATVLGTYTRARSSADRSAADLMGQLLDG